MTLRQFIKVVNLNWEEVAWGSLWAVLIIVVFTIMVLMTVIPIVYGWIMKHVVPKLYNGKVKILQESNKLLKEENFRLNKDNETLIDDKRLVRKALGE